jgi:hypothetical protein
VEEALLGSFSNMMSDNFGIEKPSLYPVTDWDEVWGPSSEKILNEKKNITNQVHLQWKLLIVITVNVISP